jgi:hypothetical protein
MNNELIAYSVLTGDMFVQTEHKSNIKFILGMKFSTAHIRIRPAVATSARHSRFSSTVGNEVKNELSAQTRLDGLPWLPTPLKAIDPTIQKYFTKHKLLRDDGCTIHPWQVVAWSQKAEKKHNAFKVLAKKDASNGWILLPLTPSELKQLPAADAAQRASNNAKIAESQAKLDAIRMKNALDQTQRENAALQEALKLTAGATRLVDASAKTSTPVPVQQQTSSRARHAPTRSQRSSISGDTKKRSGSSRRSSLAGSTSSTSHSVLLSKGQPL